MKNFVKKKKISIDFSEFSIYSIFIGYTTSKTINQKINKPKNYSFYSSAILSQLKGILFYLHTFIENQPSRFAAITQRAGGDE